jgi:small subunit ribosomal protein S1
MAPTETSDGGAGDLENVPELGLSEDVFSNAPEAEAPVDEVEAPAEAEVEAPVEDEPAAPDAAVEEAASEEASEEQP